MCDKRGVCFLHSFVDHTELESQMQALPRKQICKLQARESSETCEKMRADTDIGGTSLQESFRLLEPQIQVLAKGSK